jgi:sterol O-acyltransferase
MVARNRTLAATAVFLTSAIIHDYIIAFAFGFFYPVMFILFGGVGFSMFFVRKYVTSNVFMWMTWALGSGLMFSLYSMEMCARWNNCPPHPDYYIDLFIPRSWSCQEQFNP